MTEPKEPLWRTKDVLFGILIVVLFIIFVILVTQYTNKEDGVYGVKNWSKQCGVFQNKELSFNYAVYQDNGQLVCIFDNGVESHVFDENGGYSTNKSYVVCYRLFHIDENNGGWMFDGQTC